MSFSNKELLLENKKVKIFIDLKTVDWLAFNQIYLPIIGKNAAHIYASIYYQKMIFNHLNVDSYDLSLLLKNLDVSFSEFTQHMKIFETYKLAKLSIKNDFENNAEYFVQLFSPLNVGDALSDKNIKNKLKNAVSSEKFSEISLLTENQNMGYDLELNDVENMPTIEKENQMILEKGVYCDFYDGVFQKLEKEFQVSDEVLKLIDEYFVKTNLIDMKTVVKFAIKSIKVKEKKSFVCEENFKFLIDSINNEDSFVSTKEYENYWRNIVEMKEKDAIKKFRQLFSKNETHEFYKKITGKSKAPACLEKWIMESIKNKNFSHEIMNGMISFVMAWLKKIPTKYLAKLSETVYENNLTTVESFISHIKNVIENDAKNRWSACNDECENKSLFLNNF